MLAKSPVLTGNIVLFGIGGYRLLKFWPKNTEIDSRAPSVLEEAVNTMKIHR